jgi:hypothetical protein
MSKALRYVNEGEELARAVVGVSGGDEEVLGLAPVGAQRLYWVASRCVVTVEV